MIQACRALARVTPTGRAIAVEWPSTMCCFTLLLLGKIIMFRPLALLLQRTFDSQWRPDDSLNIVIDLDNVFPSAPLLSSDDTISPLLIDREPELYNNINFLPSFLLPSPLPKFTRNCSHGSLITYSQCH